MLVKDFFKEQWDEWIVDQKKIQTKPFKIPEVSPYRQFVWGDINSKQAWQTYTKYMEKCVPSEDYLKNNNLQQDGVSRGSKYSNWPTSYSLQKYSK